MALPRCKTTPPNISTSTERRHNLMMCCRPSTWRTGYLFDKSQIILCRWLSSSRFEAGFKSSYVKADNNLSFYNIVDNVPQFDTTKSNHFNL